MPLWTSFHASPDLGTMMPDSVGPLTKSVYDASASTQHTFHKLEGKLHDLDQRSHMYSAKLTEQSASFEKALKTSYFSMKRALIQSSRFMSGISDSGAHKVLESMVGDVVKANAALIKTLQQKEVLRDLIAGHSKAVSVLGQDITLKTQKAFAVMSVADQIAKNAKVIQEISSSAVDRAERVHLANSSDSVHEGVETIKKIMEIERKVIPYKSADVETIFPKSIGAKLEQAFTHANRAVERAERAMTLTGAARAKEVVYLRNALRDGIDSEQDAMHMKASVTDRQISENVIPENAKVSNTIAQELIPTVEKFKGVNDRILHFVDPNFSNEIITQLEHRVQASQRGLDLACGLISVGLPSPYTMIGASSIRDFL